MNIFTAIYQPCNKDKRLKTKISGKTINQLKKKNNEYACNEETGTM